jgi:SpoVK/Ycf46/Vps4 family AAA+-type ATPase
MPAALRRPGRIDRIIEFEQSPREVRRHAVGELADQMGVEVGDRRLPGLVDLLTEHGGAHVREVLERAKVLGWEEAEQGREAFHLHTEFTDHFEWLEAKEFDSATIRPSELVSYLFELGGPEVCFRGEMRTLERVKLPNGVELCRETQTEGRYGGDSLWLRHPERGDEELWKMLCNGASELFWEDRTHVSISKVDKELMFGEASVTSDAYFGQRRAYIDRWRRFMEAGRRRCVLLQGPPGVGKTTLFHQASRELSSRVVMLESDAFERIRPAEWVSLIELVDPEVLIVDDVDRVREQELSSKLSFLEEGECSVPLTLLTCNDPDKLPEAMKRPGRIDQTISFDAPGETRRKKLIVSLAERESVDIPDGWLDILDEVYREQSPAHVRELLRRADVLGWDAIGGLEGDETFAPAKLHEMPEKK